MASLEEIYMRRNEYRENGVRYYFDNGEIKVDDEYYAQEAPIVSEPTAMPGTEAAITAPSTPKITLPTGAETPMALPVMGQDQAERTAAEGMSTEDYNKRFEQAVTPVAAGARETIRQVGLIGAELVDSVGKLLGENPQALEALQKLMPKDAIKVEGGVENIVKMGTHLATSFLLLRGIGLGTVKASSGMGGLMDPEEGNLSTILSKVGLIGPFFEYLDSKVGKDAEAEQRLFSRVKNVLEEGLIGKILDIAPEHVMNGLKKIKSIGGRNLSKFKKYLKSETLAEVNVKDIVGDIDLSKIQAEGVR